MKTGVMVGFVNLRKSKIMWGGISVSICLDQCDLGPHQWGIYLFFFWFTLTDGEDLA